MTTRRRLPAAGAAAVSGPGRHQPLGIAMEGFPSPFPVRFLRLVIEGEHVNMAYVDLAPRGEPSGRTVLLLHGKNFDGGAWEPTARALVAAGHRVVVPDQIGFGRSSKPALTNYSFELLASNTVTLLDRLGVERADVVGHSMGGMLAVHFALRHPARARKLVGIRYRVTLGAEHPRWAMASALTYQMAYHQPVVADLPKLRLPVLLVVGQHDRTAIGKPYAAPEDRAKLGNYPVLGKRAAAAIPGARLVEFDDAGHLPHLERGARFEREVLAFLRQD
ncbi:alpha/beta fold hydrolase [Streptomyces sp. NPDC018584]|uniref:alpha/beta fold hydrolase n=1 Tax=unclassified Streptomyces TaxID=2593676 RepID=UPI0037B30C3B